MQTEKRAMVAFGTIGAIAIAAVVILPRLVHGESGVAALPVVERNAPATAPAAASPPTAPTTPRLFSYPSLSKTDIAFGFAGELWIVPRAGGVARRLVTGQMRNDRPIFSPDGTKIAFTGVYDGNPDVYVVAATGGEPRRLTYHPGGDVAVGWSPDGSRVVFTSSRATTRDLTQLFTVSATGGPPEQLPVPSGNFAAYSPDGKRIAYSPFFQWQPAWKHYRGGQTARIWLADLADSKITKIPRENSNDKNPMWVGDTIYFLSDRDGPMALYAYDIGANKVRAVAKDDRNFDIRSASAGPDAIVFERVGQLALYDLKAGTVKPVEVTIVDDLPQARARFVKLEPDSILHATISPTGKRVLFEAHGEILSVPAEKGDVRNLTQSPAIADRDPAWSPDGKWIAWLSDRSGEYALYFMSPDGIGPMHVINLGDPPSFWYAPTWSPDSKRIALSDKRGNLWAIEIDHPTPVKIDTDLFESSGMDASWSPDSKWLMYSKQLPSHFHAAFVYSFDTKQIHQLTDGRSDVSTPRFDKGGKLVWFLASTDVGPSLGGLDMTSDGRASASNLYALVLDKTTPSPMALESDEEPAGSGAGSGKPQTLDGKPAGVKIDFDDLDQRVVALPVERTKYLGLEVGVAGTVYLVSGPVAFVDEDANEIEDPAQIPIEVSKFDVKARKAEKFLDHCDGAFMASADGSKILFQNNHQWFVVAGDHAPRPGEGALKIGGLEVWVDPRAEWQQMFHEVWRLERDFLYDPKAHGLDLAAAEKLYAPFVAGVGGREDLNALFIEMLGNIVLGHVFVGGGTQPKQEVVPVGLLGADYTVENGHYRIAKILRGENWNPRLLAPLTQPGVVVKEGDYLLAVNGREVSPAVAVEAAFLGTAMKQTVITVAASPDGHDARKVTVVPVPSEAELRLRTWMEANRKKVDQMTNGRVGYLWVPDTGGGGFANFNRYFYSQVGKDALIIDERFNHGGQVADYIINVLAQKRNMGTHSREGADISQPAQAIFGPKVMLANQMSGSGGDALPWLWKRAKLGPLVGTRTWGGLVGIGGYPSLIDGGGVTAPRVGLYSNEGKYEVENIGVAPDVEVEEDPFLVRQGHEPQLEKAVQLVVEALEKNPVPKLVAPPFPDYGPRLPKP